MAKVRVPTAKAVARGPRGARGPQGERGEPGAPGIASETVQRLIETVESLRKESDIQLRRIADIQAQLDVVLAQLGQRQPASRAPADQPKSRSQNRS